MRSVSLAIRYSFEVSPSDHVGSAPALLSRPRSRVAGFGQQPSSGDDVEPMRSPVTATAGGARFAARRTLAGSVVVVCMASPGAPLSCARRPYAIFFGGIDLFERKRARGTSVRSPRLAGNRPRIRAGVRRAGANVFVADFGSASPGRTRRAMSPRRRRPDSRRPAAARFASPTTSGRGGRRPGSSRPPPNGDEATASSPARGLARTDALQHERGRVRRSRARSSQSNVTVFRPRRPHAQTGIRFRSSGLLRRVPASVAIELLGAKGDVSLVRCAASPVKYGVRANAAPRSRYAHGGERSRRAGRIGDAEDSSIVSTFSPTNRRPHGPDLHRVGFADRAGNQPLETGHDTDGRWTPKRRQAHRESSRRDALL